MKRVKLSRFEKTIEGSVEHYLPVQTKELEAIAKAIALRKKDAVLNLRINSHDLESIKQKAKRLGLKYQTFISEVLHQVATT